jgi:ABC-type multidrug transport system fused ATPase/permease subunit
MFDERHPVLEELIDGLFHIALADGGVHEAEIAFIRDVARIFGFSDADFARLREVNVGPDHADPYTVLGVRREQSDDEIRASWRRLMRENHPDKLVAQGLPRSSWRSPTRRWRPSTPPMTGLPRSAASSRSAPGFTENWPCSHAARPTPGCPARRQAITFGGKPLFAGITLTLGKGERVALVGANGSGKSTILKALAGRSSLMAAPFPAARDAHRLSLPEARTSQPADQSPNS